MSLTLEARILKLENENHRLRYLLGQTARREAELSGPIVSIFSYLE